MNSSCLRDDNHLHEHTLLPYIESFFIGCRRTKTKEITLANHNICSRRNEPIRIQRKYMKLASSAGKRVRAKSRLVLLLLIIGRGFCSQSQSVLKEKQSKRNENRSNAWVKTACNDKRRFDMKYHKKMRL